MDILQYMNYELLLPLILYSLGIAIYAIFIWNFYRYLAKRDLLTFDAEKYKKSAHPKLKSFIGGIIYFINYLIVVPVSTLLWFAVLSGFLLLLSRSQSVSQILLISMAIVAATRITAYYHENLSKDLAKMLPFALLGIFIINSEFFSTGMIIERIYEIPTMLLAILNYVVFAVLLEFGLKIVHTIVVLFRGEDKAE